MQNGDVKLHSRNELRFEFYEGKNKRYVEYWFLTFFIYLIVQEQKNSYWIFILNNIKKCLKITFKNNI